MWDSKKGRGGFLDDATGEAEIAQRKVEARRLQAFQNMATLIPDARKDMNDLKRDRRKRTLAQIQDGRMRLMEQMELITDNSFGHKVKFEQVTDSIALKDLMIRKAQAAAGDEVPEAVKQLRAQKEAEINQLEEELKGYSTQIEQAKLLID